jgi:hypothetical protein
MDAFMADNALSSKNELTAYRQAFNRAIEACESIWGEHAFQRPSATGWRDQFLNGVYDAQMLAVDSLSDADLAALVHRKDDALEAMRELFSNTAFDRAAREATNTPARIKYRVSAVLQMLKDLV